MVITAFYLLEVYPKRYLACRAERLLLTNGKGHQSMGKHRVGFYQIFSHLRLEEKAAKGKTDLLK